LALIVLFVQWKKRFLLLTAEGSLLVCHDASSPPDQVVLLQSSCEAIVEGKEILDLPKLPSGGSRDCCFALILPQNKYLLLLAETPADCRSLMLLYNSTGGNSPRSKGNRGGSHSVGCLRHGTISNAQAVKAVYLLMGGAAASSAIGYLGTCSLANLEAKAADLPLNADFSGMAPEAVYHGAGGPALDSLHYNSFDFEVADSDFDAFDCGGFTF
uniref:PH domain-containing protein n=1 Tax=Mola mola TaxID=94237 RepID=A0A3Q3XL17_MOLML